MTHKQAYKEAKEINAKLENFNYNGNEYVFIVMNDGSFFRWVSAFYEEHENWYYVFTEHYDFYVFDKEEVNWIQNA